VVESSAPAHKPLACCGSVSADEGPQLTVVNGVKVLYVPWNDVLRMCYSLAEKVLDSREAFDAIVSVSRGGLVPARIMSDVLGVFNFYTIRSRFWGIAGRIAEEPMLGIHEAIDVDGKNVLLVDETVDTGMTLEKIINVLRSLGAGDVKTAVLHYKTGSSLIPDFYIDVVDKDVWIFYPWSLSETVYALRGSDEGSADPADFARRLGVKEGFLRGPYIQKSMDLYKVRGL